MIDQHDLLEIYCPQMGTMMTFNYCRRVQSDLPCRNFINCWETRLEVGSFLNEHFPREVLQEAFGGLPQSRMDRIFACIEGTQKEKLP